MELGQGSPLSPWLGLLRGEPLQLRPLQPIPKSSTTLFRGVSQLRPLRLQDRRGRCNAPSASGLLAGAFINQPGINQHSRNAAGRPRSLWEKQRAHPVSTEASSGDVGEFSL